MLSITRLSALAGVFRRIAYSLLKCAGRLADWHFPTNQPGHGDIHRQMEVFQCEPGQFIRVFYFLTTESMELLHLLPQP